jgi:type IV secretory pathway TrbL component
MKPRSQKAPASSPASTAADAKTQSNNATAQSGAPGASTTAAKGKQPSATSAAGRKVARKTAHSLIERRRRSKMNEEFGVLKQMIPACKDQDMHKLAILQVKIRVS